MRLLLLGQELGLFQTWEKASHVFLAQAVISVHFFIWQRTCFLSCSLVMR